MYIKLNQIKWLIFINPRCFFTRNTPREVRDEVKMILNILEVEGFTKYLGFLMVIGRSKKEIFQFVIDKFLKRLQAWRRKILSRASKEILLKTVV